MDDKLIITSKGVIFKTSSNLSRPTSALLSKRGTISGFSKSSARRLRLFLLSYNIPSCTCFGLTLTVPWSCSLYLALRCYSIVWKRFRQRFIYRFPHSGLVYRHELQLRKMPHSHIICYLSPLDSVSLVEFHAFCVSAWCSCCPLAGSNLLSFSQYGVKVEFLDDSTRIFSYLADHTSKHKQAQLGFIGKQWGIVNRSVFVSTVSDVLSIPPRVSFLLQRFLSRIYRYCARADCVFGYKHLRRRKYASACFYSPSVVSRYLQYLIKEFT